MTLPFLLAIITGLIHAQLIKKHISQKSSAFLSPLFIFFSLLCLAAVSLRTEDMLSRCRGVILAGAFTAAGFIDAKTHTIPDWCHIWILLAGLGANPILPALTGMLAVSVPMLLISLKEDGFGGGDIKLMAACGFTLGLAPILCAALAGFSLSILPHIPHWREERRKKYALAPWLCSGCFFAYLLWLR